MKYHQYVAGNDKETEYGEWNSKSASPEASKKRRC